MSSWVNSDSARSPASPPRDAWVARENNGGNEPELNGRNETELERSDRNLIELLQEVRVVQTGVQVLFGFLLMAPLSTGFHHINTRQRLEYYFAFVLAALAAFLLTAPTAYHRLLFRRGEKPYLVTIANRLTIGGLLAVGASMIGATLFVTDLLFGLGAGIVAGLLAAAVCCVLWGALPLVRRRQIGDPDAADARLPDIPVRMSAEISKVVRGDT